MYTAPEVYVFSLRSADGCYSAAVDMWSMGVLVYVSWTGGPPVSDSESSTRQLDKVQTADGFFFDEDQWATLSGSATALIVRALCKRDSSTRMTAQEAVRAFRLLLE